VCSRTILGTASCAKYQPDIQCFAVRLNRNITNILALAQEAFSVRSMIAGVGGSITLKTAI
jgi:hypothetical protein